MQDAEFHLGEEFVYFVQGEHGGPIKIGYTKKSMPGRLTDLQCGHPYKLVVRRLVLGDVELERELHEHFQKCRLAGEWFSPVPELVEIAKARADDPTVDYQRGYVDAQKDLLRALLKSHGLGHLWRWPHEYRRHLSPEVLEALDGQLSG